MAAVARHNLVLYIPYLLCSLEGICHGIYVLWLTQQKGLSPAATAVLLSLGELALLFVELPTGIFADRFGLRRSLILGSAVQVAGLTLLWKADGWWGLLLSGLAISLGDAFRHGADEALLYRSCVQLGKEEEFAGRLARAHAAAQVGLVFMLLLGGFLAQQVSFDVAWSLEVAFALLGLLLAIRMHELPGAPASEARSPWRRLPWSLILPGTVLFALAGVGEFFVQLAAPDPQTAAVGVAALLLLEAAGAALAAYGRPAPSLRLLNILSITGLAGLAVACWPGGLMAGAGLACLASGWAPVLRSTLIQRDTPEGQRATVASAASTVDMLARVLVLPLVAPRKRAGNG